MNGITTKRQAFKHSYTSNRRATFKQIKAHGGQVKKGEKGTPIYFCCPLEKTNAKGEKEAFRVLKLYYVWNTDQTEGAEFPKAETYENNEALREAEAIIEEYTAREGIKTTYGDPAYSPTFDCLYMPNLCDFKTPEQYYLTYYHELTHSTGHTKRLNRLQTAQGILNNKQEYSKEELTAEFGACLIFAETGKSFDLTNPAEYLASRAKQIKTDNKQAELIQAIGKAEKAKNYVLDINYIK